MSSKSKTETRGDRNARPIVSAEQPKPKRETRKAKKHRLMASFSGHLLSYASTAEAAKAAGVTVRQASRWLHDPEFNRVYVEQREATLRNVAGLLRASAIGAVESLAELCRSRDTADTARASAARSILDSLLRVIEAQELEERIAALEGQSK